MAEQDCTSHPQLYRRVKEALDRKAGYGRDAEYQQVLLEAMNPRKLSVSDLETLEDMAETLDIRN